MTIATLPKTRARAFAVASLVLVLLVPVATVLSWTSVYATEGMAWPAASAAFAALLVSFVTLGGTSLALAIVSRRGGGRLERTLSVVAISIFGVLACAVALMVITVLLVAGTPAFRG